MPREEDVVGETLELAERIAPHVVDGVAWLHDALERGERILAEGAQGTMLDVTFGTYPFVTSSHTIAGGACIGLGIGPTRGRPRDRHREGVLHARRRRAVSLGAARRARRAAARAGREFGVITGRPRRCGWFDAVAARYAAQLNGLDALFITKLDVLSGFDRIGIVTGYRRADGTPCGIEAIGDPDLQVDVEEHPGWSEDIRGVRRIEDLPAAARALARPHRRVTGVPVTAVSVGPERSALAV